MPGQHHLLLLPEIGNIIEVVGSAEYGHLADNQQGKQRMTKIATGLAKSRYLGQVREERHRLKGRHYPVS